MSEVVFLRMAGHPRMDESTQGVDVPRLHHGMKVVRHRGESVNADRDVNLRSFHRKDESAVVRFIVKDGLPVVASVQNVMNLSAQLAAWSSRHG